MVIAREERVAAPQPNLARIAAGEFLMGSADAEHDERPIHRVYVGEFYIGRFPVTHDEYARFVNATGYPAPTIHKLPLITSNGRDGLFLPYRNVNTLCLEQGPDQCV